MQLMQLLLTTIFLFALNKYCFDFINWQVMRLVFVLQYELFINNANATSVLRYLQTTVALP